MARSSIWANRDFGRLWAAGTTSIFGSLVTRHALPFAAIAVAGGLDRLGGASRRAERGLARTRGNLSRGRPL
jgi:hypothetical protein